MPRLHAYCNYPGIALVGCIFTRLRLMKIPAHSCNNLHANLCNKVYIFCRDKKSRKLAIESSIVLLFRHVPFYVGSLFWCDTVNSLFFRLVKFRQKNIRVK